MPSVEVPQGTVHYEHVVGGAASANSASTNTGPVVFVHGLLAGAGLWGPAAERLGALGIESYAPELPLGAHPQPLAEDADVSPRGVARLLLDFLAALDLRDVVLVGNDTGGALCQFAVDIDRSDAAGSEPSRIAGLVLTNCDAFDEFPPAPFGLLVKVGRSPGRLRALLAPMRWGWARRSPLAFGMLSRTPLDKEMTARWAANARTQAGVRRDAARFMRGIDPAELVDVSTRLNAFDRPVLLVWGAADRMFTLDLARRLAATFPDARLVEVDGGRTFVAWDEPARVASEIAAFVRT